jgi:2',3'-cyclic-nucleotide 2'-phosphodiesterase (5'-nucleotidase family)
MISRSRLAASSALALGWLTLAACGSSTATDSGVGSDGNSGADVPPGMTDTGPVTHLDAAPDGGPVDTGVGDATGAGDATGGGDATGADGMAGDTGTPDGGPTARTITFIHTNDEHSHELGFGPEVDDYPNPSMGHGLKGGALRRAKVIEDLRAEALGANSPSVLVSSGDLFVGSLFHLAMQQVGVDYVVAGLLGYDVLTLGNHEFEFGANALASAVMNGHLDLASMTFGLLQIPVVTSNIRFSAESAGDDALTALYSTQGDATHPLRRTHVQNFGGVKVGFVGVMGMAAALDAVFKVPVHFSLGTTTVACSRDADCGLGSACLPSAATPTAAGGLCAVNTNESDTAHHFPALVADVADAVAGLRAQGVDLVVAISHAGVNEPELNMLAAMGMGPENATASEDILLIKGVDEALAQHGLPGIDIVLGGHTHTAIPHPLAIPNRRSGITSYLVQAGSYGRWVGKLRLAQAAPGAPWTLDSQYSSLVPIDDSIDENMIMDPFLKLALTMALPKVIGSLESTPLAVAGDGLIAPGEQCDGMTLPNSGNCVGLVHGATGGMLSCTTTRQLNTSACTFPADGLCGNGMVDSANEQCDTMAFSNSATCMTLGYDSGNLACNRNCTFDVSGCMPYFPSLLEIIVNFPSTTYTQRYNPALPAGHLFFASVGHTNFDVPTTTTAARLSHESPVIDLVTDAERAAENALSAFGMSDPVRVVVQADGVVRDGIAAGLTGSLTVEDLFRVLPLGVSPVEKTPGFGMIDFYLLAPELKAAAEVGVGQGLATDDFWLGFSGLRVEYDPSLPAFDPTVLGSGRVTRMVLTASTAPPYAEAPLEATPLYDAAMMPAFPNPMRLVHVATNEYIGLFLEGLGFCPRTNDGVQFPNCATCTDNTPCTAPGSVCDTARRQCVGGAPVAFATRSLIGPQQQELKEFLGLIAYVKGLPQATLPSAYNQPVPRRVCCVGASCTPDRACPPQ